MCSYTLHICFSFGLLGSFSWGGVKCKILVQTSTLPTTGVATAGLGLG